MKEELRKDFEEICELLKIPIIELEIMGLKMKCVICKEEITNFGNNAEPLAKGRCCDVCNEKVIAYRLSNLYKDITQEVEDTPEREGK